MVAILDVIKRDQIHFIYQDAAYKKYRMNVIYGIQPEIWKSYGYILLGKPPRSRTTTITSLSQITTTDTYDIIIRVTL